MRWKPHVTVAALIEQQDRFLLVEERIEGQIRFNQPAGHWEAGETLLEAVRREVLEETGWPFTPTALVGIYEWQQASTTFLRFAFCGTLNTHAPQGRLDASITALHWQTPAEIQRQRQYHRSPVVWQCLQDYLAGRRFPLELLRLAPKP